MHCHWLFGVLLLVCTVELCFSSKGDTSYDFTFCKDSCLSSNCGPKSPKKELEWWLKLTGWSCQDNCLYSCMHDVTAEDVRKGNPIRQFYGKWPFVRLFGIQEPASALFSLLNGVAVVIGYLKFYRQSPATYPYHKVLFVQLLVNINVWVWSTVFHTRDLPVTEKLDYFSAAGFIVSGLMIQFIRLSGSTGELTWSAGVYCMSLLMLFLSHISYLSFYKFDYQLHMTAAVVAGAIYALVWLYWCIKEWRRRGYVWKCALTVILTSILVLLELLDFPPVWWVLDAHALWHLSTVPLPLLWYSFLRDDAHYEAKRLKEV